MADCASVVTAFVALRDDLSALSIKTSDPNNRNLLLHRAAVAGSLAEDCQQKFTGRDVPSGGGAIDEAHRASNLAQQASGTDPAAGKAVVAAAGQANATLARIVGGNGFGATARDAFVGSLRITPTKLAIARSGGNVAAAAAEKPKPATAGYVTDVAKLFPVEAAALFPVGQVIAGNNAAAMIIIILICASFVLLLRYFATQEEGEPAWNEIGGALISFLLWVGATKGYWIEKGGVDFGFDADRGAGIFGFITIIWVALAPYIVFAKTKSDAGAAAKKAGAVT